MTAKNDKPLKTKILILTLMLFPMCLAGQITYRPLVDSTAPCRPDGHFFIVEEMPSPILPLNKIENLLDENVRCSKKERKLQGEIYIQCMVNCHGDPGDYQLSNRPEVLTDIGNQVIEVLQKENIKWKPGKQRGKSVDVFILYKIEISNGKFSIVALH
jgi:hypothetical protein